MCRSDLKQMQSLHRDKMSEEDVFMVIRLTWQPNDGHKVRKSLDRVGQHDEPERLVPCPRPTSIPRDGAVNPRIRQSTAHKGNDGKKEDQEGNGE